MSKQIVNLIKWLIVGIVAILFLFNIFIILNLNPLYGPTKYRPSDSLVEALFKWDGNDWANFKTKWSPYGLTFLNAEVDNLDLKCTLSTFRAKKDVNWEKNYSDLSITQKVEADNPTDMYLKIRRNDDNPAKFQLAFDTNFQNPIIAKYAIPQNFAGGNKDLYCMNIVLNKKDNEGNRHFYCEQYYEPKNNSLTILYKINESEFEVQTGSCKPNN